VALDETTEGLVGRFRAAEPLVPVVVYGEERPDHSATLALGRAGVHDVVHGKDLESGEALAERMRHALKHGALRRRPRRVAAEILGTSTKVEQVRRYIDVAASSEANVLLYGESGTGKELVAGAIHRHSQRRSAAFVAVNCSAIPETLLESELFGHEKGSFTGAVARTKGLFTQADGGTLFFDEIGEMPLPFQAKLLRVLQPPTGLTETTREFTRVGGEASERVDVRLIFATHRDLEADVAAGRFREDLYQRIAVLTVRVPSLRERAEDIALLANVFLLRYAAVEGRDHLEFDPLALEVLKAYTFPHNVRELENMVRSLVILKQSGETVVLGDLPRQVFAAAGAACASEPEVAASPEAAATAPILLRTLAEVELEHVHRVLKFTGGNKSRASRILGISRAALSRKLEGKDKPSGNGESDVDESAAPTYEDAASTAPPGPSD
jgi:DNA-binding NtrC family response regulator